VELTLALDELEPPVTAGPVPPLAVQANGYALVCRIPCNEDLRALACRSGEVTLRDLLDRCVLEASSPEGLPAALIFQVHRWMVEAETPLPAAMSASRWSWRSAASTMSVILPGGSLRHREPIFFRWPRSRCPG